LAGTAQSLLYLLLTPMTIQLNLSAIAVAGQAAWRLPKPIFVRDVLIRSAIGFLRIIISQ
jgi:nitrate/nitrite transport system permease protein